ncbi:MAG: hypothetical protein HYX90_06810 [Chloroflexi bacterium]|nr:hypothetical protein [Chloroflexota bacterium]
MTTSDQALSAIPKGLRKPLIDEYNSIVHNYLEGRWEPSELSGGKFCEVVYTILEGFASGNYKDSPVKPDNFVAACRTLEKMGANARSFQILIPRILPALYEIRNNRGVGHVGGDVDSNHIDATAVLSVSSWIMAELIRVFHDISIEDAQRLADSLIERRTPLVWHSGDIRRVLNPDLGLRDQVLVLLSNCLSPVVTTDLLRWLEPRNPAYLYKVLRTMHGDRLVELSSDETTVQLLPPGGKAADLLTRGFSQ